MEIKITLFITFLCYAVVASQGLFYILAMSDVTKKMQLASYIESRKLLDQRLQTSLRLVYYVTLAASVLLVSFCVVNPAGLLFICAIVSLICLIADIIISIKGNVPINKTVNSWTLTNHPADWTKYRRRWLSIYSVRQIANVIGFTSLLVGMIFGM